jgi:Domain of unknown function (DUF1772)
MWESGSTIVSWLFVVFLGITFGAGLCEARVVVPNWTTSAEGEPAWSARAARRDDVGRKFWAFVTTGPLTLLTLASLVIASRATGQLGTWWLGAALAALTDRVLTFSYFIPTMVRLLRLEDSPEARAKAMLWANLNYVRLAIVLVAWLGALKAFSLLYAMRG